MSTHVAELSDIRLMLEAREASLDARAAKSNQTKGRARPEAPDPYRTEWQRDRDRIIHTKAFRRLKHKTQVFISPEHDHHRTRLTHTLEVTQIARTVSRALGLNEDLTEAIGLGHDLGHAPFGHVGEEALDEAYRRFDSSARFRHYEQSLRVVDELEKSGDGLNLTWEVRDGILHHSKGKSDLNAGQSLDKWLQKGKPSTLEGQVIRICDRVAYVNHDIDDAIRAGLIKGADLPLECVQVLGKSHAARITTMVNAILEASSEIVPDELAPHMSTHAAANGEESQFKRVTAERIAMCDDVMEATDALKSWMFEHVYLLEGVGEKRRVQTVVGALFERFMDEPQLMKKVVAPLRRESDAALGTLVDEPSAERARRVCDFIAGMTDRFASQTYAALFMPSSWRGV